MELREYLKTKKITMEMFAQKIGRAQSIVSRLVNRKHRADPITAQRIVKVTKGAVSLDDIYNTPPKLRADYLARNDH